MDSGNTAWVLASAALVVLLCVGIVFYYAGLARAKNVLNIITLGVAGTGVTAIVWALWGWSLAFAGHDGAGIIGDPATGFLLRDATACLPQWPSKAPSTRAPSTCCSRGRSPRSH
jgi:Amt family ammonium transporter